MLRIETFAPARRCTAPSTSSLRRRVLRHPLRAYGGATPLSYPLVAGFPSTAAASFGTSSSSTIGRLSTDTKLVAPYSWLS